MDLNKKIKHDDKNSKIFWILYSVSQEIKQYIKKGDL